MIVNADVTIYNRYMVAGVETYQRTQIQDVKWESTKAVSGAGSGRLSSNAATVYIPYARGTNYLDPKAWQALVSKTGKWTLDETDFIVKGLVTDEIGTSFTMTALKAKYDDVLQISSVDAMQTGSLSMWHWQVGAK